MRVRAGEVFEDAFCARSRVGSAVRLGSMCRASLQGFVSRRA